MVLVSYFYKLYGQSSYRLPAANAPVADSPADGVSLDTSALQPAPTVKPTIRVSKIPDLVKPREEFSVDWQIEIAETRPIFHSAAHWGQESKSGEITVQTYPYVTKVKQGTIPAIFSEKIIAPSSGKIYLRAHVIVDQQNYWTEEKVVEIKK